MRQISRPLQAEMAQGEMEIERNCAASNPFFYPLGAKKQNKKTPATTTTQSWLIMTLWVTWMCTQLPMYTVREIDKIRVLN